MKALTVRQPWAHAVCWLGKAAENRTWRPAPAYRGPLLLHAAKGCTGQEYGSAARAIGKILATSSDEAGHTFGPNFGPCLRCGARSSVLTSWAWCPKRDVALLPPLNELPRGALVGRCELVDARWTDVRGHQRSGRWPGQAVRKPCALCGVSVQDPTNDRPCPKADPWAERGSLALILEKVQVFKMPVPWTGQLGFFDVPDDVIEGCETLGGEVLGMISASMRKYARTEL